MSTAPEGLDLKEWERWDQKSKDKFLDALEKAGQQKKVWYCKKGRTCDGKPHDEYTYNHARGDQWPPADKDWLFWLLKGGRGSGKTRSGAEWIRYLSGFLERVSIIGPTWSHVRDTMVEGDSGLLTVFANAGISALWEPSKRKITVPCTCAEKHRAGHIIQVFTGEEPARLRGPQHGAVWLDEPAHFDLIEEVWPMMLMGLRLGKRPLVLCTTTPLPTKWMKKLIADKRTRSVTASTYANLDNLAPTFKDVVLAEYEGTRLGRQELYGEILDDIVGALWTWSMIEGKRDLDAKREDMERIVVSIDPAGTSSKKRDETGIVVLGKRGDHYYVLADLSGTYTPEGWASAAWKAFDDFQADKVVAEKNYGGEMVLSTLKTVRPDGPVRLVHSRRGKALRAEPVVSLYEQERVHHVGTFETLEEQMTEWVPGQGDSPDRVDALVHGVTDLSGGGGPAAIAVPRGNLFPVGPASGFGGLSGFGYTPREAAPTEADCTHERLFESQTQDNVMVCENCLAEMDVDGNVWSVLTG